MKKLAITLALTLSVTASKQSFAADFIEGLTQQLDVITMVFDSANLDKEGCVDDANRALFEDFIGKAIHTSDDYAPSLEKFCYKSNKNSKKENEAEVSKITWEFGITPRGYASKLLGNKVDPAQDFWTGLLLNEDTADSLNSALKAGGLKFTDLSLERKGGLEIVKTDKYLEINLEGFGMNFDTWRPKPGIVISSWAMHFYVKGIRLDNDGSVTLKLGAPFFGIPVSVLGAMKNGDLDMKAIKVFGKTFNINFK